MTRLKPGQRFRVALHDEKPLQIVGAINAYAAIMAQHVGFKTLYLSGAGVANSSCGLPDLGMTTLSDVLINVERIVAACDLPLLVDIDTGWGSNLMIARTIKTMEHAGAAAVHIEDQPFLKRCGHLPGKEVISCQEMVDRLKAAVDARHNSSFVIMARTDALAVEGLDATIARAQAYIEAGADMLFCEGVTDLKQFQILRTHITAPILANMTEFGVTPLWDSKTLANVGVDMALYPLSANRAMNLAALRIFEGIRQHGTQYPLLETMQTREELYGFLDYESYEEQYGHR